MHIKGYMAISMRHVAGDWVIFKYFALSGSRPHGNNYGSLNMHVIDTVCISINSQSQWQYFEIEIRSVAYTLRDTWPFL